MSDLENNVRFTWQLVSQFVSWEFCRYMCEQKENEAPETDVLTFLRNMIVQRTEKSMSEITKHEIVAKFIMETKEIQHISRISCIIPLSESVKKIFPELEPAVSRLVHYLETFLNVLDSCDEVRRELLLLRIEDAINEFIKEANELLPQPHLIQIIEPWSVHQGNSNPKPVKRVIYNSKLFEKVLECLHFESITQSEAKLIAVSLYEDKVFEKILFNAEAEPETEADSEQFSLQSSQPVEHMYSQEFAKNSQTYRTNEVPLNLRPPNLEPRVPDSLQLNNCPSVMQGELPIMPDVPEFESNNQPHISEFELNNQPHVSEFEPRNQPPHVVHVSPSFVSPQIYPFMHREISEPNGNNVGYNNIHSHMQFAQSSANESESDDCNSTEDYVTRKFKQIYENQKIHRNDQIRNASGSDTSDCEKNEEIRFLTPTLFKKSKKKKQPPKSQVVWLSDVESNNSSVLTNTVINSQQNDPNWTERCSLIPANWAKKTNKTSQKKNMPTKKKKKKPAKQLDSDSSDGASICSLARSHPSTSTQSPSTSAPRPSAFEPRPSTSAAHSSSEDERPTKRSRVDKSVKLYRSPNIRIQDFFPQISRPTPVTTNEVPVHKGINTRSGRKPPMQSANNSDKKQRCKQCPRAFKTLIALRRHIFLKHTNFAEDSDNDS